MQSICIFCGSSVGRNSTYIKKEPAEILDSLRTFKLPGLDKWGNLI